MNTLISKTTKIEQTIALNSLKDVQIVSQNIKSSGKTDVKIQILEIGEFITIPKKALNLLAVIIQNMAEGKTISIVPSHSELSTQQAADMLHISRPYFIKLLEMGKIPFFKVGSHRRVLLKDVKTYEEQLAKEREAQLDFLAEQAQNLNLGYE
ncbi:MAG: excisionase family DNA-binding protein [Chitinophagales bacterium]